MKEKKFTKEEQLDLFSDLFGSQELIELYIEAGKTFCDEAELKLFALPFPDNQDMVIKYIEQGHHLCEQDEVKLFDLPLAEMILETYCFGKLNILHPAAQMRLLEAYDNFPKFVKRYIRAYKKTNYLSEEFQSKAQSMGLMK